MLRLFKKNRAVVDAAPVNAYAASQPAAFGLFGVYVRSLPKVGR